MVVSKEQAEVYEIIATMIVRIVLAFVVLCAFIAVLVALFFVRGWSQTVPLAALEIVLTGTVFQVFKHYFPAKK